VIQFLEEKDWFDAKTSLGKLSRLATLCQMAVYNKTKGPDGEGPQALRRHWYHWYKVAFAQKLANQVEAVTGSRPSDAKWESRISDTYSRLVDEGATYWGLWVDDASRKRESFYETLFNGESPAHILLCVEKDSLYDSFLPVARAIGARSITSGGGKNSRASAEKILREHFNWTIDHDPFTDDNPLIVIHVSDWDYDGEAVIGPTFGNQMKRYTPHVREARVGIFPQQVLDEGWEWPQRWYEIKTKDSAYLDWAEDKGLYVAECLSCGNTWPVQGVAGDEPDWQDTNRNSEWEPVLEEDVVHKHQCPECFSLVEPLRIKVDKEIISQPYGFEVEAVATRSYFAPVVDALLSILSYDDVVRYLRRACKADAYQAAERVMQDILDENETYQAMLRYLEEYERVLELKETFENEVREHFHGLGEPHVSDWEDDDDDPDVENFREHASAARDYTYAWRPFRSSDRTDSLVEFLREEYADDVEDFQQQVIDWQ
jgi:hypothetical protein